MKIVRDPFSGVLLEGLIKTIPPQKAEPIIKRMLSSKHDVIDVKYNDDNRFIISFNVNDESMEELAALNHYGGTWYSKQSLIQYILQLMNNLGYFPSYIIGYKWINSFNNNITALKYKFTNRNLKDAIDGDISIHVISLMFEAKYESQSTYSDVMYHITNSNYIDRIKQIGLIPKAKNKQSTHPNRIYFSPTIENSDKLWNGSFKMNFAPNHGVRLKVNVKGLTLYEDPNFPDAVYTYQNVSPNRILDIKPIIEK